MEINDKCLDGIKIICENGSVRKISKTCIENIKIFLIDNI